MTRAEELPRLECCPFCGSLEVFVAQSPVGKLWRIGCNGDDDCFFTDFDTKEAAIAAWNRRADTGLHRPTVEACAMAVEAYGDPCNARDIASAIRALGPGEKKK